MRPYDSFARPIKDVVDMFVNDPNLGEQVTYRKYSSQSFNDSLGHSVSVYSESSVEGLKLEHTEKSALSVDVGSVQAGDRVYLFKGGVLPSGISLKDQIEDSEGQLLKVKGFLKILDVATAVTVESD